MREIREPNKIGVLFMMKILLLFNVQTIVLQQRRKKKKNEKRLRSTFSKMMDRCLFVSLFLYSYELAFLFRPMRKSARYLDFFHRDFFQRISMRKCISN